MGAMYGADPDVLGGTFAEACTRAAEHSGEIVTKLRFHAEQQCPVFGKETDGLVHVLHKLANELTDGTELLTNLRSTARFEATAQVLEDTGVHAYLGQAGKIKNPSVLYSAATILPVEARHSAWIRDIRFSGGSSGATLPAPSAFEDGFSKAKILAAVKATGFIVG